MATTTEGGNSSAPAFALLPDEPLALSAPLARRLASELCPIDPAHGRSCAWYHGLWQYLRLFDLVTTPRAHADFYRAALLPRIRGGGRRALISGAADYAMLAHLLASFRGEGVEPAITVLDLCPTPLRLSEWYAARRGASIETVVETILAYHPADRFDILCTHSFFGRFAPAQRPTLIARWHDLLRPGGCVVTINRVRAEAPDAVQFTAAQAERFVARVRAAAARTDPPLDVEAQTIADMAAAYAANMRVHPVRSTDELARLFEAGGFRIERLSVAAVGSRGAAPQSGPTVTDGAKYAQIVAVRS